MLLLFAIVLAASSMSGAIGYNKGVQDTEHRAFEEPAIEGCDKANNFCRGEENAHPVPCPFENEK